ncbi:MAG: hypothetical protein ACREN8_00465 [Candidatus Dormibacteraceae bacterium]
MSIEITDTKLMKLFERFLPRVIENEEQLNATQRVIDELVEKPEPLRIAPGHVSPVIMPLPCN